ncbi:hypothetical protein [Streptomyces sp. NPDC055681]
MSVDSTAVQAHQHAVGARKAPPAATPQKGADGGTNKVDPVLRRLVVRLAEVVSSASAWDALGEASADDVVESCSERRHGSGTLDNLCSDLKGLFCPHTNDVRVFCAFHIHLATRPKEYDVRYADLLAQGYVEGPRAASAAEVASRIGCPISAAIVELSEFTGEKAAYLEPIAEAARIWDGSDPVPRLCRSNRRGGRDLSVLPAPP